ncbi:MAG: copper-translocating P-type ATPase [Candidatus Yanofskybacteria bacterium RIFCSPHIGHO2_02_FULL_38_22b]|uniref:P-type Cu(+) transporter n=1 Tax=Candidatus Yanofskybacteria bacterium RIFCSPHIGHO2_02_FULL_38_22b TaxID=1802673 RepID=A0A1F8F2P5_9BACT|nr:MAG: copper-translocating P-type ATPase [Candidatus Yanofskybacteria bacterium RIFCSPHIGHO2_02_FULL_38_22b]OGN20479.1 MAG: copper-translocating P-type ATPase [Candidatus Yanofskybacteria bacterium RIFCSPLOWO2_01_FULL_39_28]
MQKVVLKVKKMHCASCSILIDKLVGKQAGVQSVKTSYGSEKTVIEFDENKITLEKIDELINKLGYDLIRPDEKGFSAEEEEKREAIGVEEAHRRVKAAFILAFPIIFYYMAIHMFNVTHVHELFDFITQRQPQLSGSGFFAYGSLITGYIFWLVAQPIKWFAEIFIDLANPPFRVDLNYIYWVLSTPIQFVIAWPFYRNSFTSIRVGSANMDVLVALGTSAAYFYSAIGFLFFNIDHPFWESSAALLFFILLGRYFEAVAKGRASEAIKELLKLEAKEAHVIREGKEITVPLDQLVQGEIIVVRPGEKIAVDGIIIEGETHIDEKVVTGESFPVKRIIGDQVIGATVNQEGLFKFKATKVGKETLLYQIVAMVEEAQARKAPIQDLVDKISESFVPAVVVLSVLTFVGWYFFAALPFRAGLIRMIAVLVISCPCAMGLATPTALIVGIGRAAKFGIILKGGEALEKAYRINAIAFDKTGTLTEGKPVVTDLVTLSGFDAKEAIKLAGAVEVGSEHPLARAIIEKGKSEIGELPEVKDFKAVSGFGVQGTVEGKMISIGNTAFMKNMGVNIEQHASVFEKLQNEAKTVVFANIMEGNVWKPIAIIAMADTLKPYAKEAVAELKKMKKEIIMITGDNPKTAEAIAREIGIDRILAQVLPQQKTEVIKKLQEEGKTVAMVGDGINDSPALAQSNLGIAVGSGTDVAVQTGEVILVKDDLRDVVTAIQLSGRTIVKVWQNLFWAFIYNVVAIPIAAGAHLIFTQTSLGVPAPWTLAMVQNLGTFGQVLFNFSQATLRPEIAGFAMAFSSVSVVTNSLLLRRYVPPMEKLSGKS